MTQDFDGSNRHQLERNNLWPTLSADGKRVMYVGNLGPADPETPDGDIIVSDADGSNPHVIVSVGLNTDVRDPRFGPSGRTIAFALNQDQGQSFPPKNYDIWNAGDEGQGVGRVLGWSGWQIEPAWSADGQMLAFSSNTRPDGSAPVDLLPEDGTYVGGMLYVAAADGAAVRPLLHDGQPVFGEDPAFDPNGDALVFSADNDIYRIGLDGANLRRIATNGVHPDWAFDRTIVYDENQGESQLPVCPPFCPTRRRTQVRLAQKSNRGLREGPPPGTGTIVRVSADGSGRQVLALTPNTGSSPHVREATDFPADGVDFRPRLYFDTAERFRPQDIPLFLSERDLTGTAHHEICEPHSLVGAVALGTSTTDCSPVNSVADLALHSTPDSYLREVGATNALTHRSPTPGCATDISNDCDAGLQSAIYLNLKSPVAGYTYYDYWFFYRYNDYSETGGFNHEGDWEGIYVVVPRDAKDWSFAGFSAHGQYYTFARENLRCDGHGELSCGTTDNPLGKRPNVYVANGSHANYPTDCITRPSGGIGCAKAGLPTLPVVGNVGLLEKGYDGERAWGNQEDPTALSLFPRESTWTVPSPQRSFTDWPGRWGDKDDKPEVVPGIAGIVPEVDPNSPRSPGCQDPHFHDPSASDSSNFPCKDSRRLHISDGSPRQPSLQAACAQWTGPTTVAVQCDARRLSRALRARQLRNITARQVVVRRSGDRGGVRRSQLTTAAYLTGLTQIAGPAIESGDSVHFGRRLPRDSKIWLRVRAGRGVDRLQLSPTTIRGRTVTVKPSRLRQVALEDTAGRPVRVLKRLSGKP